MLWRRHRLGLVLTVVYLFAAVLVAAVLPNDSLEHWFVKGFFSAGLTLMTAVALFLLVVFCMADGDLAGRESCFPASLFTLPVRTGALAGWVMAYAAVSVGLLWVV